ncbi:malate-2H(+)/Na(+)-lactate antiporter [Virgibacillus pantothenticus]|uniref:Antiporter n=1 Tax=Virgibacillus pantothenticus TaxID=1473 RepID=A0A0L0QV53_VIRPA|nr:Na+/H+ antiporter NhaC [Virgibacillus pantothenticus]KNE22073.1 antiporter [Virgibacillus pantothenticus]MBU8566701.1 Na+/H+ antiporter NhaC [Virgibacillus pantothenticus]MBU8600284.1 Na+/H+ antiporter NhaC [Virgibacillus pantothenticus]MBU8634857.1 Na+/H+ antiporter NhaC [Virgibacillus pantothenticus]MBU8642421.1 Na+/H+ antiporter NhaC [Virgibacillus pantothenticus]
MEMNRRLPTLAEVLFVLISFVFIMFLFVVQFSIPIQLGLLTTWFVIMLVGWKIGYSYKEMQDGLLKGVYDGSEAVLILISVGALIGTWIAGGIVPSIIYYGLTIIQPSIFLVAAFIICAITSIATGTSFGSAGTAGIAMMGIGTSFDLPVALVAGAVISGCYVGDKISPLSDTTVMSASLSKVNLVEHIKSMLTVSGPAFLLTGALFLLTGYFFLDSSGDLSQANATMTALNEHFTISWYMLIPAILVIGLLAMKMPSIPVILFGALLGTIWAYLFQNIALLEAFKILYQGSEIISGVEFIDNLLNRGGIVFMLDVIVLIIFALGVGGLMEKVGILQAICLTMLRWANSAGKTTVTTLLAGFFGNFFGGAAYVSIITASKITEENYDRLNIDRRVLSRNTEAGGTMTTPMVPWSDGGVFMATTLGVTTLAYLPFLWFNFLVILITIIYGFTNTFIWYTKAHGEPKANQLDPEQAGNL